MNRTHLGEEPVLNNVETYSLAVEDDRRYVMDHFDELVIKSRSGWGGKDVLIASEESREDIEEFRKQVEENPVEYVAQETIDFSTHVLCETDEANDRFVLRDAHADYRIHALAPDDRGNFGRHDEGGGARQQAGKHLKRRQDEGHLGAAWCMRLENLPQPAVISRRRLAERVVSTTGQIGSSERRAAPLGLRRERRPRPGARRGSVGSGG
jgi:hypothetical protein